MTSIQIFVRHDAQLDACTYFDYIHERNAEAALRFVSAIDQTIESLALQPLKGRPRRFRGKDLANVRSWRVNGFETYLVFYRYRRNRLEILRIRHGGMRFPRALRRP